MSNFVIRGQHDQKTIDQMQRCLDGGAVKAVLCADGHLGYSQPVGGVVAHIGEVSISGVGYDIGCGNTAIKTDLKAGTIAEHLSVIAEDIKNNISFGVGRNNDHVKEHFLFEKDSHEAWNIPFVNELKRMAFGQLGTVGSGNHYVDVFADEEGSIWVGVHFGSRGLGHKIATEYLKQAGGKDGMDVPPTLVDVNSSLGAEYICAMDLAGKYASAGREWVVEYIAKEILGANIIDRVENHHNFAWQENHYGQDMWVIRKGATPSFPNQRSFVGGSMGTNSVILRGLDNDASRDLLYSTVHGAGRVLSRTQAAGKFKGWGKKRVRVSDGLVNEEEMRRMIEERGTILIGAGPDEAPQCYRQLDDVLQYHSDTVTVEHTLTPLIVAMASGEEFDPYKD